MFKLVAAGISAVVMIILGSMSFFTVDPTERAVVTRAGAFEYVAGPGLHFKMPFIGEAHMFRVDTQALRTPKLNTLTVDNQEVDAEVDIRFNIPPEAVQSIYEHNQGYEQSLQTLVANEWKDAAGKVNIIEFASNRVRIGAEVQASVAEKAVKLYHLNVTYLGLSDVDYAPSFRQAQANAALVKTAIEQAHGTQEKTRIEAETAKIEAEGRANQAIEAARGQAEATKLQADADAYSRRTKGEADANAQELMAAALSKNPALVELTRAERWNGQLPSAIYGSAPIPFMGASAGR